MKFHGIDLHHDSLLDTIAQKEDLINLESRKYYLSGESFEKFKSSFSQDDYVVVESCSNAFWLHDQIKGLVKKCYILNTIKFKSSMNKTDKIDAKKLAKKLAYFVLSGGDDDDFPTIFVPSAEVREIRDLFTTYRQNKKQVNQAKNRIYSILRSNGIQVRVRDIYTKVFKENVKDLNVSETYKFEIELMFDELNYLEKQLDKIILKIKELGYKIFLEEIEIIISAKGFSAITAIALMTDVVNIDRFPSAKKLCAYLRTAPGVKGSNEKNKTKGTNKQSRSLSISFLSQSVNHFGSAGEYLTNFYGRVKKGKKAGVYRMAIIRKMLVCVFHMLKNKKKFYWTDDTNYNKKLNGINREINKFKKIA